MTTALQPPDLSGIRAIAFAYGVRDITDDEQGQIIEALFTLCDVIEHLHAYAAEVVRLATEAVEEIGVGHE